MVQKSQEQTALCLWQRPRPTAPSLHPFAMQKLFAPCFTHSLFHEHCCCSLHLFIWALFSFGMVRADSFCARISAAHIHFADPHGTVLRADKLALIATHLVGGAARSSAGAFGSCFVHCLPLLLRGWCSFVECTRRFLRACRTIHGILLPRWSSLRSCTVFCGALSKDCCRALD